ncbi:unnamed protein product [Toxocara canis]|uniref:PX domain-containing protein n=1 Tax=Toxocara canis TaxID=6265 RepID=A0A183V3Q3_TOXCA|nr:unnamed protein product [Toxocara canis]
MSVLVCESSPSYNEFTRLLLCPVPEWSFQARVANVAQGGSVITQHTQYQLVVTAVPRNSIDMDVRCFSLWTRFRDLSHLWSQLSKIHQQLYLHGTFPTFAPAKFFGNSEPSVIAERIEATGRFLNFVLASEVLRKTRVLHQFFAAAEEVSSQIDSTPPLSSTNVASSSAAHILEYVLFRCSCYRGHN